TAGDLRRRARRSRRCFGGAAEGTPGAGPLAPSACRAYTNCLQYTIRGIPPAIHDALRPRARAGGQSLKQAVVHALAVSSGMAGHLRKRRDLSDIAGTWKADKAVESALAAQDVVDADLWK